MNAFSKDDSADQANAAVGHAPIDQLFVESSKAPPPVPRVVAVCPSCKATLSVRRAYVGNAVQCKYCGQVFTVLAEVGTPPGSVGEGTSGGAPYQAPQDREDLISQLEKRVLELVPFQAEHDSLAEKVKLHEGTLCAVRAERDALATNLREQNNELVAARTELAQLTRRIEQSETDLQAACQEREQLSQQLALCRNDLALALADLGQLRDTNQELLTTQARRESEYDAMLNAERTERQQLAEEVAALRATALESAQVGEQLISANLNPPAESPAPASELEAVRVQAEELKFKLEEAEYRCRTVTETLNFLGISIDLPPPHRAQVEAKR